MRRGLKSLIGGAHCVALHPFMVAIGWFHLFGVPWDLRRWCSFGLHDIGYVSCDQMDGESGDHHVLLGARVMGCLFGPRWESDCIRHSRAWCRKHALPISRLCLADKLAFVLTPDWLYLPMARWTGELDEYMEHSRRNASLETGYTQSELNDIHSGDERRWLRGLKSYTLRWVELHGDEAVDFVSTKPSKHLKETRT